MVCVEYIFNAHMFTNNKFEDKYYNFYIQICDNKKKKLFSCAEFTMDICLLCHMCAIFISRLHKGKRFMHGAPNTAAILYRLQCIDRLRQLPTLYVVSE